MINIPWLFTNCHFACFLLPLYLFMSISPSSQPFVSFFHLFSHWSIGSSPVICPANPEQTICGFWVIAGNVLYSAPVAITPPRRYLLMLPGLGAGQPDRWFAKEGLVIVLLSKIPVGKRLITRWTKTVHHKTCKRSARCGFSFTGKNSRIRQKGKTIMGCQTAEVIVVLHEEIAWNKLIECKTAVTTYCFISWKPFCAYLAGKEASTICFVFWVLLYFSETNITESRSFEEFTF